MRMTAMMTKDMMTAVLMLLMTLGERCCRVCEECAGRGEPTMGAHGAAILGLLFCLTLPWPVLGTNSDFVFPNKCRIAPPIQCDQLSLVSSWPGTGSEGPFSQ